MTDTSPAACGVPLLAAGEGGETAILDGPFPRSTTYELVGLVRLDIDPAIFRARPRRGAPSLCLALQLRMSSWPAARRAGRCLGGFALRPGEAAAIRLPGCCHEAARRAAALCVLDGHGAAARSSPRSARAAPLISASSGGRAPLRPAGGRPGPWPARSAASASG